MPDAHPDISLWSGCVSAKSVPGALSHVFLQQVRLPTEGATVPDEEAVWPRQYLEFLTVLQGPDSPPHSQICKHSLSPCCKALPTHCLGAPTSGQGRSSRGLAQGLSRSAAPNPSSSTLQSPLSSPGSDAGPFCSGPFYISCAQTESWRLLAPLLHQMSSSRTLLPKARKLQTPFVLFWWLI